MLIAGLILLCVATIISNTPVPQGNWIAVLFATIALILFCLYGTRGFARADIGEGSKLMSHVETRSHRVQKPADQTSMVVHRSGDVRLFFVASI